METLWFWLVAVMIAGYVVFDGFDLGAGALHLWVAKNDRERRMVLRSIGPVWDGNEVWLLAAGGTLYFAFPALYASSFSGFYLPLMIVLWLLILRGIAIEFRNHVESPVWTPLWDVVFSGASLLLAIFYGAALANVMRGVPLDANGRFFAPLWTDFGIGGDVGILDWYTVPVGLTALAALLVHGGAWIAIKTEGELYARAKRAVLFCWWPLALLTALITLLTWRVQPQVAANLAAHPWGYLFPALAIGGLAGIPFYAQRDRMVRTFLHSTAYLVGMLTSAVYGVYPYVLPSNVDPARALTVENAAAPAYGLKVGLAWWIPGMLLVAVYFLYTYRKFAGKVTVEGEGY
jgi:cytochrome bd ubiquinol oxidase subunit II